MNYTTPLLLSPEVVESMLDRGFDCLTSKHSTEFVFNNEAGLAATIMFNNFGTIEFYTIEDRLRLALSAKINRRLSVEDWNKLLEVSMLLNHINLYNNDSTVRGRILNDAQY